ncbi:MAG: hypothetical protein IH819_11895 [Bacteroidetes bacterium]|nr:hypothetical protein [Bacteroidota bacterium]
MAALVTWIEDHAEERRPAFGEQVKQNSIVVSCGPYVEPERIGKRAEKPRRELIQDKPPNDVMIDFFITLSVLSQNRKFLYKYNIIGKEEVAPDIKSEFKRKIRFASTNFQTLSIFKKLLFSNNMLLSFAFWSHKVIRWFVPLFLILLIPLNILLLHKSNLLGILFIIQMVLYFLALLGFVFTILNVKLKLFSLFSYFILTNVALFLGLYKYLRGKHSAVWESTPR